MVNFIGTYIFWIVMILIVAFLFIISFKNRKDAKKIKDLTKEELIFGCIAGLLFGLFAICSMLNEVGTILSHPIGDYIIGFIIFGTLLIGGLFSVIYSIDEEHNEPCSIIKGVLISTGTTLIISSLIFCIGLLTIVI